MTTEMTTTSNEFYRTEEREDRLRLVTRNWTASLVNRHWDNGRSYGARTVVYGAVDTFASAESATHDAAVQVDPDMNHKALRVVATRRAGAGLREALEVVREYVDQDVTVEELAPRFNGRAGCSCGCSPGFVLNACLTVRGKPVDVWFDATYENSLTRLEKAEREKARRDAMVITPADRAQAVFYGMMQVHEIKQELGV